MGTSGSEGSDCETHFMDQTTNQLPRVHARVCLRVHSVLRCTLRRESEIARRGGGSNVHGSVCARSDQSVDSAVSGWKSRARASNQKQNHCDAVEVHVKSRGARAF